MVSFLSLSAQNESNWWYFGRNAGLNFNTGSPNSVTNGALSTLEGCATISSSTGNLLFYTDGSRVYNRNHAVMTNGTGLLGNGSSTSSAVIVKKPGSSNSYYIFTVQNNNGPNGLRYSEVDMSQSSGLGSVLTTNKNTSVNATVSENLTAVGHANGRDVWVVAVTSNTNSYLAYLVSSTGVAATPVTTTLGPPTSTWGFLKASADGKRMAIANGDNGGNVVIFDFNNSTGVLSNPIQINAAAGKRPYGVEFSLDMSKLYYTHWFSGELRQLDLNAGTNAQVIASDTVIFNQSGNSFGALQLGVDGKIYLANNSKSSLGVINNPNLRGTRCNFNISGFALGAGTTSQYGLPTFNQSFFTTTTLEVSNSCKGVYTVISVRDTSAVDSVYYDYGDPSSGAANNSWNVLDSHRYMTNGKFAVTAYTYYTDPSTGVVKDTLVDTVEVIEPPVITLGNDTVICKADSIFLKQLNPSMPADFYWQDSSTTKGFYINSKGSYWAKAVNRCGVGRDTVVIDSLFSDTLNLGPDTVICLGRPFTMNISDTNATYVWNDSTRNPIKQIDSGGVYWAKVTNVCGVRTDSRVVNVEMFPHVDLGDDRAYCPGLGERVFMNDTTYANAKTRWNYKWQNGLNVPVWQATGPGKYWVQVSNQCGVTSDTINLTLDKVFKPDLGPDTVICDGRRIFLDPDTYGADVSWSNGWTDTSIYINAPDTYIVVATNACGSFRDTVIIESFKTPSVDLPNDTIICSLDTIRLEVHMVGVDYQWSHGPNTASVDLNTAGIYSVTITNGCGRASDQIKIDTVQPLSPYLGADTLICSNRPIKLFPYTGRYSSILWNDGSKEDTLEVTEPGTYQVRLYNRCGSNTDEIVIFTEAPPVVQLGKDTVICDGQILILKPGLENDVLDESTVVWQNKITSNFFKVSREGLYQVKAENRCGFTQDSIYVSQQDPVYAGEFPDTIFCNTQLLYNLEKVPYDIEWQDGSKSKLYSIWETGDYSISMMDEVGCQGVERFSVKECSSNFYAPTGFTPNNNAINEGFRVYKTDIYDFSIMILNRWNQIVFESNDITETWDGTHYKNGTDCPIGVYLWKVTFKELRDKQEQVEIGEVNIIR